MLVIERDGDNYSIDVVEKRSQLAPESLVRGTTHLCRLCAYRVFSKCPKVMELKKWRLDGDVYPFIKRGVQIYERKGYESKETLTEFKVVECENFEAPAPINESEQMSRQERRKQLIDIAEGYGIYPNDCRYSKY